MDSYHKKLDERDKNKTALFALFLNSTHHFITTPAFEKISHVRNSKNEKSIFEHMFPIKVKPIDLFNLAGVMLRGGTSDLKKLESEQLDIPIFFKKEYELMDALFHNNESLLEECRNVLEMFANDLLKIRNNLESKTVHDSSQFIEKVDEKIEKNILLNKELDVLVKEQKDYD
eukprot:Pgem_evm1s9796